MNENLNELDVIALLQPMAANGLHKGQVGTLLVQLDKGNFEVEFLDNKGMVIAVCAVHISNMLQLHHQLMRA